MAERSTSGVQRQKKQGPSCVSAESGGAANLLPSLRIIRRQSTARLPEGQEEKRFALPAADVTQKRSLSRGYRQVAEGRRGRAHESKDQKRHKSGGIWAWEHGLGARL